MFSDIIIIGAGPCGLAVAARLCERTPSALFTNDEHARYWKKRHHHHITTLEQEQRNRKRSTDSGYGSEDEIFPTRPSITVIDASSNEWLSTWKQRFQDLHISHLRSPLFFHPDPRDRDGLLAFTHEQDRINELREIPNVVGKELSKHERKRQGSRKPARKTPAHLRVDGRDRIDYFTPSSQLFLDHCDSIIDRYKLRKLVQQAKVLDITYDPQPPNLDHGLFTLKTDSTTFESRIVIIATGPSSEPTIPNFHNLAPAAQQQGSISHVFQPNGTSLPAHIHDKLTTSPSTPPAQPVNILIVGGGLTSAQLIDLLLTKYPTTQNQNLHIHLLLRHKSLKQKPFDISLPWVTKTRNHLMSTYWSADSDTDRDTMLKEARNGGSVTPHFAKILQKHVAAGRLTIYTDTQLNLDETCTWDEELKMWTDLNVTSMSVTESPHPNPNVSPPPSTNVHHIIYCTGLTPTLPPFLDSLRRNTKTPLTTLGEGGRGLPTLTQDLAYSDSVPLFFTGALAALRLGPGAANLAGARQGAERVAWGVEEILALGGAKNREGSETGGGSSEDGDGRLREEARGEFTGSSWNQFDVLGGEE